LSLNGLENHLISTISGGEKTRVSLGAALLGKPELLILDEPTVGIDPLLRAEIWDFLHEIAASGTTLVVSSHVMDEAAHCSNLILLRNGQVLATGSPSALKQQTGQKDMEAAFLHLVRQQS
jgi:ABC-2 type transport system ATP-binding protein